MSISTTYFTRMAEQVAAGRSDQVGANLDESIRALSVFAFGFMAALAAASVPISRVFSGSREGAVAMAIVLCAYLIALVPFGVLVIVRRAFFAFHDTRTPFFFSIVQCALAAAGALAAFWFMKSGLLAVGLVTAMVALTQSLSTFVQLPVALRMLRRHTGVLHLGATWRALGRFALASAPAFAVGWLVFVLTGADAGWTTTGQLTGVVGAALIGGVSLLVYVGVLALLRTPELGVAVRSLRRALGR